MVNQSNTIWNGMNSWKEIRWVQVGHNTSRPARKEFVVGITAMVAFDNIAFENIKTGV